MDEFRKLGKWPTEHDETGILDRSYKEYLEYYENKTIDDITWYIDDDKNIIAEIIYHRPWGATDGEDIIRRVNITEIIKGNGNI